VNKSEILAEVRDYIDNKEPKRFIPGKSYIPATSPTIGSDDISMVVSAALDGWFTEGKQTKEFKRLLAKKLGMHYVQLTNSGSSASLLAIRAMEEQNSMPYVITTALNFPTTISMLYTSLYWHAPLFIDIDPYTLTPNLYQLGELYDEFKGKIAGVILPHTLGFPFEESKVREIIGDEVLFITDCCDALGAYTKNNGLIRHVGYYADYATLSFFPAHHITTGEGGAVLTNHPLKAEIVRSLANWGRDCYCLPGQTDTCGMRFEHPSAIDLPKGWDHKYTFTRIGYNLKMTELQAALGVSQIMASQAFFVLRKANFDYIKHGLSDLKHYLQFVMLPDWSIPSPFGFPILVNANRNFSSSELIAFLEKNKIRTRRFFGGNIIKQPAFSEQPRLIADTLKGTDWIMEGGFWIGCQQSLTIEMLDYMIDIFHKFFKEQNLK